MISDAVSTALKLLLTATEKINNWAGIETGEEKTNEAHKSHNLTMRTKQRCCAKSVRFYMSATSLVDIISNTTPLPSQYLSLAESTCCSNPSHLCQKAKLYLFVACLCIHFYINSVNPLLCCRCWQFCLLPHHCCTNLSSLK